MHPSLWKPEDFYEIQASFALQETPIGKPTFVTIFIKDKIIKKGHLTKYRKLHC